jgi:DNA-binding response OmpR family regulator
LKKVLIMEEDAELSQGLSYLLREQGFNTAIAFYNEEGPLAFLNESYSLLLLDIGLTEGTSVAKRMRDNNIAAPILIFFNDEKEQNRFQHEDISDYYYLIKPFDANKLVLLVKEIFYDKTTADKAA